MTYDGYVRVIDANNNILDVTPATLGPIDHTGHSWGGSIQVSVGGGLVGKIIPVELEVPDLFRATALLLPGPTAYGVSTMTVLGGGDDPFE